MLLTQDDLRPLVESNEQLIRAFERLERAILHQKHDPSDRALSAEVGLGKDRLSHLRLTPLPDAITLCWASEPSQPPAAANAELLLLCDPHTGELLALLSGDDLNPLRTALPAAVGVRRLASPGARALAILGSGRQAHAHLRAYLPALPKLTDVRVFSPLLAQRQRFAEEARQRFSVGVVAVDSALSAVEGADVVVSLEGHRPVLFESAWLQPGALVVQLAPGGVPADLARIARVVVPVRPENDGLGTQTGRPVASADLADIISGLTPPREHDDQIVLWDMTVSRPWDPPIANWAYKWAVEHGVGTTLALTSQSTAP